MYFLSKLRIKHLKFNFMLCDHKAVLNKFFIKSVSCWLVMLVTPSTFTPLIINLGVPAAFIAPIENFDHCRTFPSVFDP